MRMFVVRAVLPPFHADEASEKRAIEKEEEAKAKAATRDASMQGAAKHATHIEEADAPIEERHRNMGAQHPTDTETKESKNKARPREEKRKFDATKEETEPQRKKRGPPTMDQPQDNSQITLPANKRILSKRSKQVAATVADTQSNQVAATVADTQADKFKKNEKITKQFAINHERSISQFLFRAPPAWKGGPGSKAFKYEKGDADSESAAYKACVEHLSEQCRLLGCDVPIKCR